MKILLTGASGFLGKWVLRLLLQHESVTEVQVISRSKESHPDPRVSVIRKDLSNPSLLNHIRSNPDVVIHLAGLYEFGTSFAENYRTNVLGTQNLLDAIRHFAPTRILHASSYAVGIGESALKNAPLPKLPPREHAYAYTKALAERLMEQAQTQLAHRVEVFRLGILIGDSKSGGVEKLDGPYSFYKNLLKIAQLSPDKMPLWIPADPEATLPLVAVDEAAQILVHSAMHPQAEGSEPLYHAVYRTDSVTVRELMDSFSDEIERNSQKRLIPMYRPINRSTAIGGAALRALEGVLGSSAENFLYAQWKGALEPGLHESEISHWQTLRQPFFSGVRT